MTENEDIRIDIKNYRCFFNNSNIGLVLEKGKSIAILGKNNSGKSSLIKFFYELKPIFSNFDSNSWSIENKTHINTSKITLNNFNSAYDLDDIQQLFANQNPKNALSCSINYQAINYNFSISLKNDQYILKKTIDPIDPQSRYTKVLKDIFFRTMYIGPHRNIVNKKSGGSPYYDLSVGSAFISEWSQLKNGSSVEKRNLAKEAEQIIKELLDWETIEINISHDSETLLLGNQNNKTYRISELGSGISELVICIITAAIKKPSWILIDEPESHLHPTLQLKFLTALEQLTTHGIIFTTHSIGLARSYANTIFYMEQNKDGSSKLKKIEDNKNYSAVLGELQFSQYSELGYDKILLCEGVTEIKALRQLLRLWSLDSSVVVVSLGGSSLIDPNRTDELKEFQRFTEQIFVLIDSEKNNESDVSQQRNKFISVCKEIFGEKNAIQTERRALENYFTQNAINKGTRSEKYKALDKFSSLENGDSPRWGKNENWRITNHMTKEELENTDIGCFFEHISKIPKK